MVVSQGKETSHEETSQQSTARCTTAASLVPAQDQILWGEIEKGEVNRKKRTEHKKEGGKDERMWAGAMWKGCNRKGEEWFSRAVADSLLFLSSSPPFCLSCRTWRWRTLVTAGLTGWPYVPYSTHSYQTRFLTMISVLETHGKISLWHWGQHSKQPVSVLLCVVSLQLHEKKVVINVSCV